MKNKFFVSVCVIILSATAGCASKPTLRPDYVGLPSLETGWSRVYLSAGEMSGVKLWSVNQVGPVFLNGMSVGKTAKDEHLIIDLKPGTYEAYCVPEVSEKNLGEKRQFTFVANQTRYLACDMEFKAGAYLGLIGALAADYLSKTYLVDRPLGDISRLVLYNKIQ